MTEKIKLSAQIEIETYKMEVYVRIMVNNDKDRAFYYDYKSFQVWRGKFWIKIDDENGYHNCGSKIIDYPPLHKIIPKIIETNSIHEIIIDLHSDCYLFLHHIPVNKNLTFKFADKNSGNIGETYFVLYNTDSFDYQDVAGILAIPGTELSFKLTE